MALLEGVRPVAGWRDYAPSLVPSTISLNGQHQCAAGRLGEPRIVVVCTANRCRSPLAEHTLRQAASARGLVLDVSSVGFLQSGLPMPDRGIKVAREFGLDLSDHLSTQVSPQRLLGADLVLGMSRAHGLEIMSELPELWPRIFTMKQFAAFTDGLHIPKRARLDSWVSVTAEGRSRAAMMGHNAADDVRDPLRASSSVWRQVVRELQFHSRQIVDALEPILRPAR